MLKNVAQIVKNATVCVVSIGFHCICYAGITEHEISIDCSKGDGTTLVRIYSGRPDTQLSLVTKGMRVAGIKELIVDWDEFKSSQENGDDCGDPSIFAECVPYANGERLFDIDGIVYEDKLMWPPNETLVCNKGEGISVAMYSPNDEDPKKYQYVATLVKSSDECKKNNKITVDLSAIANCLNRILSIVDVQKASLDTMSTFK